MGSRSLWCGNFPCRCEWFVTVRDRTLQPHLWCSRRHDPSLLRLKGLGTAVSLDKRRFYPDSQTLPALVFESCEHRQPGSTYGEPLQSKGPIPGILHQKLHPQICSKHRQMGELEVEGPEPLGFLITLEKHAHFNIAGSLFNRL